MNDSIALIVVLSFIIPFFSMKLFKGIIPSVAFEILIGFILGRSGFNIIHTNSEIVEFLSTFGLIFLMFLSGLESDVDLKSLKGKSFFHSPLFLAILIFTSTFLISGLFSSYLVKHFNCSTSVLYLTLIFSTTSVAIVFPTLKAREDLKKVYKQTLLQAAFVADFLTLMLISLFSVYKVKNKLTVDSLLVIVLFGLTFLIVRFIKRLPQIPIIYTLFETMKHKSHIQIGIRGSFAILFLFIFLAEKLGVELILGSFLAGIIISTINSAHIRILRLKLDAIGYGFFIPFFFIAQGAKSTLPLHSKGSIEFIILIVLGGILVKVISATPLLVRFSLRETISAGVLLSGRLSLIIAASIIGLKLGIISEEINASIIILAAITCISSPSLFNIINPPKKSKHLI
ncbi:cation:proton antiporter [Hippea jasoniae]|uniref:cation:proton antiporter n=1 Tax=Hippea jasoniae TaxID=944479 RepID=UPI000551DA6D|nr:cation:proton antiporter [Hippea jasoniae]